MFHQVLFQNLDVHLKVKMPLKTAKNKKGGDAK